MKAVLYEKTGEKKSEINLPSQFNEPVREDLISRAVLSMQSKRRTKYGAYDGAGMRYSTRQPKRRRKYRGMYGIGISRVPRKIMSRSGTQFNRVAALAPGTVGGRKAHPPKSSKIWLEKINKKERIKAIRSAIAATAIKELVEKRGHKVPSLYPFVVSKDIEGIDKTKTALAILNKLGLKDELERSSVVKIRAGRGKMRNRKYQKKKGLLIVVSGKCRLEESCRNIQGVDVVDVLSLNVECLAPGTFPGRITLWSEGAIEKMEKEKLFM